MLSVELPGIETDALPGLLTYERCGAHIQLSHACVRPRTGRLSARAGHSSEMACWESGDRDS